MVVAGVGTLNGKWRGCEVNGNNQQFFTKLNPLAIVKFNAVDMKIDYYLYEISTSCR